jgi:hypothetical protein
MTLSVQPSPTRPDWRPLLGVFGAYAIAATALSASGVFPVIGANYFALTVVLATSGLIAAYAFHAPTRALAERLGPYGLAGFHVWRVPAALTFFWYGSHELLPDVFVTRAAWGDLVAGLLAGLIFLLPRRRATVLSFHLFGLADFILAVGTGVVLTLTTPEAMAELTRLPVSLIPLVGVPLSGATHLAALHLLATGRAGPGKTV